jgi:hypothetical protein
LQVRQFQTIFYYFGKLSKYLKFKEQGSHNKSSPQRIMSVFINPLQNLRHKNLVFLNILSWTKFSLHSLRQLATRCIVLVLSNFIRFLFFLCSPSEIELKLSLKNILNNFYTLNLRLSHYCLIAPWFLLRMKMHLFGLGIIVLWRGSKN